MSTKTRIYDLAKQYGMTGQDLAGKLRDLGFSQVKSHMTALSEFEVLEIQARLEAYGIVGESRGEEDSLGGLKIKRRKKKKKAEEVPEEAAEPAGEPRPAEPAAEEAPPEAPAPPPAAEPPAAPEPAAGEAAPAEPHEGAVAETAPAEPAAAPPAETPAPAEAPAPKGGEEEKAAPAEAVPPAEPAPAAEVEEPAPAPAERQEPAPERPERKDAPAAAEPSAPAPAPAEEAAPEGVEAAEAEGAGETGDIVRPSAQRRQGKVVGFIDPSKFQQRPGRKTESRRLRSQDDAAPEVMPTLGRDRSTAFRRGDAASRGKLTAQQLRDREAGRFLRRAKAAAPAPTRRRRDDIGGSPHTGQTLRIEEPITIKKLANALAVKENQVLQEAWKQLGFGSVNINSTIDEDTAGLLAQEFEVELDVQREVTAEERLLGEIEEKREKVEAEKLLTRPPCVAFLGHVDHGKTTLIDTIRSTRIVDQEAGGITQHIGAYQVETQLGHKLTIIDTPGHAAFTAMRARGANAVDVVVLVVAADDGVKPQTEEALNHARAAGVPIVIALNKVDKPDANVERVRNELAGLGLTPEEWGGETAMMPVSALQNLGVEELLERVFLESEVLELRAHTEGSARGIVLEAEVQRGKGKVAHLLVQDGSLKSGDIILAGEGYGKVRSMHDDRGNEVISAGPSLPVEVTGLNELPFVGDKFVVVDSLDRAQEVAEEVARKNRELARVERRAVSKENLFEAVARQERPSINLIVKADVQGSIEVLKHQLDQLQHEEVEVKLLHAGVGEVLESDVDLAATSNARILAFHVSANNKARQALERHGVEMRSYGVIYELLDDVRRMMEGELSPEVKEEITGHAEIRRVFKSSRLGNIAGCYMLDGLVHRNDRARLLRDGKAVWTGGIGSLRREKDDVREVREGYECGIVLRDQGDIREGDVIETFRHVEVKRTIEA